MSEGRHLRGLPVAGYQPQSEDSVARVNRHKVIEEHVLRLLDTMPPGADPRWTAIARTHLELAFMAMNRAVFRPSRVKLDDDQ